MGSRDKRWLEVCANRIVEMDLEAIPEGEELAEMYTLSQSFQQNMTSLADRVTRRERRRRRLRVAAAAAILLFLLFNLLQPQYSVNAYRRIMEWFEDHAVFRFRDDAGHVELHGCEVKYLPEGYELVEEFQDEYGGMMIFSGDLVLGYGTSDSSIYVNNEGVKYYELSLEDGVVLHCLEAVDGQKLNCIFWTNKEGNIVFDLSGSLSMEELMKIQEGIQLVE